MTQTASLSPKTMLAYRDELVRALRRSSDLLDQAEKTEIIKHEEKGAPRILTTEDLPKLREIIAEEIQKLNHFDVVLSVVGIMKAGKSTTINAIVGQEIMPNRNQAMTTLPTLIYHTPEQVTPKLSFVAKPANTFVQGLKTAFKKNKKLFDYVSRAVEKSDELRKIVQDIQNNRCLFKAEYSGSSEIFDFLEQLNDLVRLAGLLSNFPDDSTIIQFPFDDYQKISQLPKIEVEFASLKNADPTEGRLVLLDTPGPNEAGQKHLKHMLDEQLQRSSAVLLIMDYTQLNSEASEKVKNLVENLPTLDEDRLFVLANKFDEKDANSQDEAELKQYIKSSLPPGKVRDENIFPVSAKNAFLASRMLTELKNKDKPEYDKGSWVGDFAKQAFGVMNPSKWEKVMPENITETANILIEESLIQQPIDRAIANTQKHAPRIAMRSALARCHDVLERLHNICEIWARILGKTEEDIKRLNQTIADCQSDETELSKLETKIRKEINRIHEAAKKEIEQHKEKSQTEMKNLIVNLIDKEKEHISKRIEELEQSGKTGPILRLSNLWTDLKDLLDMTARNEHSRLKKQQEKANGEEIFAVFGSEEEAHKFLKRTEELYNNSFQIACTDLQESIYKQIGHTKQQLSNTESKTQSVFDRVQERLHKEKIVLQLSRPEISDFSPFERSEFGGNEIIQTEKSTYYEDSDGFFSAVARGAGWVASFFFDNNWGREKVTETSYSIPRTDLQQALQKMLQKDMGLLDQETKRILDAFGDEWVKNYIEAIREQITQVLGEIRAAIETATSEREKAERKRQVVEVLQEQEGEIQEDIKMVRGAIQ